MPLRASGLWQEPIKNRHSWFGYLLHLAVDASFEVPMGFAVTKALTAEQPQAQRLLDQMQECHPEPLERCSRLSADKGYDDSKLIMRLWDQHQIKPVVAIRNCWQDGDAEQDVVTELVRDQQNVTYTYNGEVPVCARRAVRCMAYGGFEGDREALKYRRPVRYSGTTCKGIDQRPVSAAVRILAG